MAGTRDDNLGRFRSPDHLAVVSAETQQCVLVPVEAIEILADALPTLPATGVPAWFHPEAVRDDLRAVHDGAADVYRPAIERALPEADYACRNGSGIGVVPPPAP